MVSPLLALRHEYRCRVKYGRRPRRYRQLLRLVRAAAPATLVEIGVYTGQRAVEMIEAARLAGVRDIRYTGFDLFDQMDGEKLDAELSKWPDPIDAVRRRIAATGAAVTLIPGLSQETLPAHVAEQAGATVDFAFIDGGHAVETIRSDWTQVSALMGPRTTVVFDDYYVGRPDLTEAFGCNQVVESLDRALYDWEVLEDVDVFEKPDGPFRVAMVVLRRAGAG